MCLYPVLQIFSGPTDHPKMGSNMEDPDSHNDGPTPLDTVPFEPYDVELTSALTARMLPVHSRNDISGSLMAYLTKEMNDEVIRLWQLSR